MMVVEVDHQTVGGGGRLVGSNRGRRLPVVLGVTGRLVAVASTVAVDQTTVQTSVQVGERVSGS